MKVPLFPLQTVLFPGGVLPLRIFEVRYMDMVRDCMKNETPFGVCLISRGAEVGQPAEFEAVGCLASIVSWDMAQLGVLSIRTIGSQRFRVHGHSTQPDGLQVGEVELIDPDRDAPLDPRHQACADLVRRVVADLQAQRSAAGDEALQELPLEQPYRYESTVWIGNRICEFLPVPMKAKQKLMELEDAATRLDIITRYLKQHDIIR
jgi:Lon protease-like protein